LRLSENDIEEDKGALTQRLLKLLNEARHHSGWSRFSLNSSLGGSDRTEVEEKLTAILLEALER
jgi:hypothetical protein